MFIYLLYFSLNPESACKQDHLLARLKVVVEAISANSKGNSKFHSISFKCKIVMGNFQNFMVRFVRRQANLLIHSLIRTYRFYASSELFECISFCIYALVMNKMK